MPLLLLLLLLQTQFHHGHSQQAYFDNKQLDCYVNHTATLGYTCNGAPSCTSFLTFRTTSSFSTLPSIARLLSADPTALARANNNATLTASFPENHLLLVPVNCSCATVASRRNYYQHNTTYTLNNELDTYMTVANDTLEGLTSCQSMMSGNPSHDSYDLAIGYKLVAPLFCACPSVNQIKKGYNYIVSYLTDYDDDVTTVALLFGVDEQRIFEANQLDSSSTIYPYNPLLIPLETPPTNINLNASPAPASSPPPPPPPSPPRPSSSSFSSSKKWMFVGIGIGVAIMAMLILLFLLIFVLWNTNRKRKRREQQPTPSPPRKGSPPATDVEALPGGFNYAIESLMVYKFESIKKSTNDFSESNRIKGSVFKGTFNGDDAAVKVMNGDVSPEISILKQINHSNIIRLSGFCVHEGNTYLVYEFAEKGSLRDLLVEANDTSVLGWKQRIQIAYGIADGLNYLHNYCHPLYVHKNLSSSNVLLDGNLRAKITNFGLARTMVEEDMRLTKHVVGTKGFLAPEYIEDGAVSPKMDVYAFGMVILELLSGRIVGGNADDGALTSASITEVLEGENVREKLSGFMDDGLRDRYPLDLAYSMAQLAKMCVASDLNSRLGISEVLVLLSKIHSSSLDWDCSDDVLDRSSSLTQGR